MMIKVIFLSVKVLTVSYKEKVNLGGKIGAGKYRLCFSIESTNLCAKVLKQKISKTYFRFFTVRYNAKIYTLLKFWVSDFNRKEYEIFNNLPAELKDYLPSNIQLSNSVLVMKRPINFDNTYSKTVECHGVIDNRFFWMHVDKIVNILVKHNLFLLDTFHLGNNILVNKVSQKEWKPILIDVKRLGFYTYPFQPHLVFKSQQKRKFYRRLKKFKESYSPKQLKKT